MFQEFLSFKNKYTRKPLPASKVTQQLLTNIERRVRVHKFDGTSDNREANVTPDDEYLVSDDGHDSDKSGQI